MVPSSVMKFIITAPLLLFSGVFADVTLYEIIPTDADQLAHPLLSSVEYSVGGVDSNGRTTYIQQMVVSGVMEGSPTPTTTYLQETPLTTTITLVADASHLEAGPITLSGFEGEEPGIYHQSCSFEGTTRGVCIQQVVQPESGGTSTYGTTLSGALRPVATFPSESTDNGARLNLRTAGIIPTAFVGAMITVLMLY